VLLTQQPLPPSDDAPRRAARPAPGGGVVGGALAGGVAAAPALGASLLSACLTCLGAGTAATAGVAAGAGVSLGGVAVGVVVLAAVILLQAFRARTCPAAGTRGRYLATRIAVTTATAVASFVLLQWLTVAEANPPAQQQPSPVQRLP
jgi:hypothetical protein